MFPGAQHLQNLHPLVVHFPIAFLTGAAFCYLLAWMWRNQPLATTACSLLILGMLSALAAVGTGLYAEPGVMVSRSVRTQLVIPHKQWMIATTCLCLGLTVWAVVARPFPRKGRPLFLLLLLVMTALMTKGADYGGRMVYDYNAGGNACPQPIEFAQ